MRNTTFLAIVMMLAVVGCNNNAQVKGPMAPGPQGIEPLEAPTSRDDVYDPNAYNGSSDGYDHYDENRPFPAASDDYSTSSGVTRTLPPYTPPTEAPPYTPPPAYTPPQPPPTHAPAAPPAPVAQRHVIQKGDTLWAISTRYLGAGKRWKEIVAANPGIDARKLPIGKEITIPAR